MKVFISFLQMYEDFLGALEGGSPRDLLLHALEQLPQHRLQHHGVLARGLGHPPLRKQESARTRRLWNSSLPAFRATAVQAVPADRKKKKKRERERSRQHLVIRSPYRSPCQELWRRRARSQAQKDVRVFTTAQFSVVLEKEMRQVGVLRKCRALF